MEIHAAYPAYGAERITRELKRQGFEVGRRRATRPRTTWSQDLRRRGHPRRPTRARDGRRDLAQLPNRPTSQPITDRLRPLGTSRLRHNDSCTLTFAHGTTTENVNNIAEIVLNGDAARAASHGGVFDKPGSLYTYQIDGPTDPNFVKAAQWSVTRNSGSRSGASVLVFGIGEDDYNRLRASGDITTQVSDEQDGAVEHVFGPEAYPYLTLVYNGQL